MVWLHLTILSSNYLIFILSFSIFVSSVFSSFLYFICPFLSPVSYSYLCCVASILALSTLTSYFAWYWDLTVWVASKRPYLTSDLSRRSLLSFCNITWYDSFVSYSICICCWKSSNLWFDTWFSTLGPGDGSLGATLSCWISSNCFSKEESSDCSLSFFKIMDFIYSSNNV